MSEHSQAPEAQHVPSKSVATTENLGNLHPSVGGPATAHSSSLAHPLLSEHVSCSQTGSSQLFSFPEKRYDKKVTGAEKEGEKGVLSSCLERSRNTAQGDRRGRATCVFILSTLPAGSYSPRSRLSVRTYESGKEFLHFLAELCPPLVSFRSDSFKQVLNGCIFYSNSTIVYINTFLQYY